MKSKYVSKFTTPEGRAFRRVITYYPSLNLSRAEYWKLEGASGTLVLDQFLNGFPTADVISSMEDEVTEGM